MGNNFLREILAFCMFYSGKMIFLIPLIWAVGDARFRNDKWKRLITEKRRKAVKRIVVFLCGESEGESWCWRLLLCASVSGEGCSLILKPSRVVVGFGESVTVSCEATRPVRVLGWESALSAPQTHEERSVQWRVDSLIDWIEEPICYGVFFTAPRQCEEKLNLVLYSESELHWNLIIFLTTTLRNVN